MRIAVGTTAVPNANTQRLVFHFVVRVSLCDSLLKNWRATQNMFEYVVLCKKTGNIAGECNKLERPKICGE